MTKSRNTVSRSARYLRRKMHLRGAMRLEGATNDTHASAGGGKTEMAAAGNGTLVQSSGTMHKQFCLWRHLPQR